MPKTARKPGRPSNPIPREVLLQHARAAFAEAGYAGASMDAIATRAGIRKSSLFHHFSSKEALYQESLAGLVQELASLVLLASTADAPFIARLQQLTDGLVQFLGAHPTAARLLLREFVDAQTAMPAAGSVAKAAIDAAATFLQGGMDEGVIPRQPSHHLALTFVGVHLSYFAMPDLSSTVIGHSIFSPEALDERQAVLRFQTERLVGLPLSAGNALAD